MSVTELHWTPLTSVTWTQIPVFRDIKEHFLDNTLIIQSLTVLNCTLSPKQKHSVVQHRIMIVFSSVMLFLPSCGLFILSSEPF